MNKALIRRALATGLILIACTVQAEPVADDFWLTPRSGERVMSEPAIETVLRAWVAQPQSRVVIRYPGGEEGVLWANDLRDWLVACGLSSSHIQLLAGSGGSSVVIGVE